MKLANLLETTDLNSFCVLETHLKIQSATKLASFLFYKKETHLSKSWKLKEQDSKTDLSGSQICAISAKVWTSILV